MGFIRNFAFPRVVGRSLYPAAHIFIVTVSAAGQMKIYCDNVLGDTSSQSGNWVSGGKISVGRQGPNGNYLKGTFAGAGVATGFSDATAVGQLDTYLRSPPSFGSFRPSYMSGNMGGMRGNLG
jgi:hypothetical protein